MKTLTAKQKIEYGAVIEKQNVILQELEQLKTKLRVLGSLRRFEDLAKKGRRFARQKSITRSDILEND